MTKVKKFIEQIAELEEKVSKLQAENFVLRQTFENLPVALEVRERDTNVIFLQNQRCRETAVTSEQTGWGNQGQRTVIISKQGDGKERFVIKGSDELADYLERYPEATVMQEQQIQLDVPVGGNQFTAIVTIDAIAASRSDSALRQREKNFNSLFHSVNDFLWILDDQGNIVDMNRTVVERLGYSRDELQGRSVLTVHPPGLREAAASIVRDMLAHQRDFCPIPIQSKSGEKIPVETYITQGEWNGRPALFGVSKDISNLKQSEEKFAKAFQLHPEIAGLSLLETGEYVQVNPAFLQKLEYTENEVIGRTSYGLQIISEQSRDRLFLKMKSEGSLKNEEAVLQTKTGKEINVLLSADIMEINRKKYIYTIAVDVTAYKQTVKKLHHTNQIYEAFFAQSLLGFFFMMLDEPVLWPKSDEAAMEKILDYVFEHQRVIKINSAMLEQYRAKEEDFIGLTPKDFFAHDIKQGRDVWKNFFDSGRLRVNTNEKRFDGTEMTVEGDYICIYDEQGRITGHFGIQQDITGRVAYEKRLVDLYENAPIPYQSLDIDARILNVNKEWLRETGYDKAEVIGKSFENFISENSREIFREKFAELLEVGFISKSVVTLICKGDKQIQVAYSGTCSLGGNRKTFHSNCIFENISEKLRLENAAKIHEERASLALNVSNDIIFLCTPEGIVHDCNEMFCRSIHMRKEDILGKNHLRLFPEAIARFRASYLQKVVASRQAIDLVDEQGSKLLKTTLIPVFNDEGEVHLIGVYARDITEIEKTKQELQLRNRELLDAVNEKDLLLKEVHHRVKNNLQTIQSLLFKQQRMIDNSEIRSMLQDSMDRISVMAMIHEQIYNSSDLENIDFHQYISDFARNLFHTYSAHGQQISLDVQAEPILMSLEKAIPCGLIINELVSNALKYAFIGRESGSIAIRFYMFQGKTVVMEVEDDGVGLPDGFDPEKTLTLGMFIIKNVATRQLGGELSIESKPGARFIIKFPA